MTLDEAIRRERRAMRQTAGERSEEHRQVAEWLRELATRRELAKIDTEDIGTMSRLVDDLRAENEELRIERDHWHVEQVHAYGNWEDVHKYATKLKAENDRLRELVETMRGDMRKMLDIIFNGSDTWGYCRYYEECLDAAEGVMRELGIEVAP